MNDRLENCGWRRRASVGVCFWLALAPLLTVSHSVRGAPAGQAVVAGSASFSQQGALTTIQAGNNTIINYQSFDILANETVRFIQPGPDSRVLNRVLGELPTSILGHLEANGQVYIANPAGIFFGNGAYVNVGGLVAAAGHIADGDFLNNVHRFTGVSGDVMNSGSLTADSISLIGQHVANPGELTARNGLVTLLAGDEVLVGESGGNVFVNLGKATTPGGTGVENTGSIHAGTGRSILAAGDLYSLAVLNSGAVQAREISLAGQGGGVVRVSGNLDASDHSPGGGGGEVRLQGARLELIGPGIEATGDAGDGSVTLTSAGAIHLGADVTAGSVSAHSGTDGSGNITFGDGVEIRAATQSYRAGDGAGDEAAVSVGSAGNTYFFRSGAADEAPLSFTHRQDATIPDWNLAAPAQFGGAAPANYAIRSDGGAVTLSTPEKVRASALTISAKSQLTLGTDLDLTSLHASGAAIQLNGRRVTTTADQIYDGPLTLRWHTTNVGTRISFLGTVNGTIPACEILKIDGDAVFGDGPGDFLGNQVLLMGIQVSGSTWINGGIDGADTVATSGVQSYGGPVTIRRDTTLRGSEITFRDTVNATIAGCEILKIDGNAVFGDGAGDFVGNLVELMDLNVTGSTVFNSGNSGAATVSAARDQLFRGEVTLGADTTLTAGRAITFDGPVNGTPPGIADGASQGNNLILNNGGLATLNGAVVGVNQFAATGAGELAVNQTISAGSVYDREPTTLSGGRVTTTAEQIYDNAVTLGADARLQSSAGGDIRFNSTVDGAQSLAVNTAAQTIFGGAVGAITPPTSLTTDAAGRSEVNARMRAGTVAFNDPVMLAAAGTANEPSVLTSGNQTYNGAVSLDAATILESSSVGNIQFSSTVNGAQDLTVNTAGQTIFDGAVGAASPLASITTDGAGSTVLNAQVRAGRVTINDPVTLTAAGTTNEPTVLTSGDQTYNGGIIRFTTGANTAARVGDATVNEPVSPATPSRATVDIALRSDQGDIHFNQNRPVANSELATIFKTSPGDITIQARRFVMGQNEKFVSTGGGDITIQASERATVGDLAALGDIVVSAPAITLLQREPVPGQPLDHGLDFIGANVSFNPTASLSWGASSADQSAIFASTAGVPSVPGLPGVVRIQVNPPPFGPQFDETGIPLDPQVVFAFPPCVTCETLGLLQPVPYLEAAPVEVSPAFTSYENMFNELYLAVLNLRSTLGARNAEAAALLGEMEVDLRALRQEHRDWAVNEAAQEHNPEPSYRMLDSDRQLLAAASELDAQEPPAADRGPAADGGEDGAAPDSNQAPGKLMRFVRESLGVLRSYKWDKRHLEVSFTLPAGEKIDSISCVPIGLVFLALKEQGLTGADYEPFEQAPEQFAKTPRIKENRLDIRPTGKPPTFKRLLGLGHYYFWPVTDKSAQRIPVERKISHDPNDAAPVELRLEAKDGPQKQ